MKEMNELYKAESSKKPNEMTIIIRCYLWGQTCIYGQQLQACLPHKDKPLICIR